MAGDACENSTVADASVSTDGGGERDDRTDRDDETNRDGEPARRDADGVSVIVVGYDGWTESVVEELLARGDDVTVVLTDESVAAKLRERGLDVVRTDAVDEACFDAAGLDAADAVLVATLDEQLNVLAVLTVMNANESARVATFAREQRDVSKLRAAGADTVIGLGQVVGELLVEVALTDRSVDAVVDELTVRI